MVETRATPSQTPPLPPAETPAFDEELRLERLRRRRRRYTVARLLRANLRDLRRLLQEAWIPLIGFAAVQLTGALYFLYGYDDPEVCLDLVGPCNRLVPALFQTARLMLFDPDAPFPRDGLGQLLFFLIPVLGLTLIVQSVLDFGRLLLDKGNRREAWQVALASTFSNHVVVCGLGRVSYRVVLQLLEVGQDVVVIERDWSSEFVATTVGLKVPVVVGDAREPAVLEQAGLARARGLIAGINDDLLNLEVAMAARRRRPNLQVVMRIFSQELDTALERSLGRNTAFSSSSLAAPTMAAATLSRGVGRVLPLRDGLVGIAEVVVAENSEISGFVRTIEERFDVRVLRLRSPNGRERRAGYMEKLEGGDQLLVFGQIDALDSLRIHNQPGSKIDFLSATRRQRITESHNALVVCGLGKVGYRLVKTLFDAPTCPKISVICSPETRPAFIEELRRQGATVIVGDAREPELLRAAGIEQAYAVAAVTGDDLTNLQIGLSARQLCPEINLVLRVFSDVLAERLVTLFGIHTTFSSSALAAPTLAATTMLRNLDAAVDIGDRLFATVSCSIKADDELAGRSVAELYERAGVHTVALYRNNERLCPPPFETRLAPDDEAVLLFNTTLLMPVRNDAGEPAATLLRRKIAGNLRPSTGSAYKGQR